MAISYPIKKKELDTPWKMLLYVDALAAEYEFSNLDFQHKLLGLLGIANSWKPKYVAFYEQHKPLVTKKVSEKEIERFRQSLNLKAEGFAYHKGVNLDYLDFTGSLDLILSHFQDYHGPLNTKQQEVLLKISPRLFVGYVISSVISSSRKRTFKWVNKLLMLKAIKRVKEKSGLNSVVVPVTKKQLTKYLVEKTDGEVLG